MAQLQRVKGEKELKCEAHKFFDVWACKPYLIPKICPNKFTKIELLQGHYHQVGALKNWTYLIKENCGERTLSLKTRVEELDVEKLRIRYSYHGGFLLKHWYKFLESKMEVTPNNFKGKSNNKKGCIVKWSFEYEKMNDTIPEPNMYIDYLLDVAKDVDAYCLCNA